MASTLRAASTFAARASAFRMRPISAHIAQTLAQRLKVIKPGIVVFGMVTAQDDFMLIVTENAPLEFARY